MRPCPGIHFAMLLGTIGLCASPLRAQTSTETDADQVPFVVCSDGVTPLAGVRTHETQQGAAPGTDLNADGDFADLGFQVIDLSSGPPPTVTNTAVDGGGSAIACGDTIFAFTAREANQGPGGSNLNADGDTTDEVLYIFDASMGVGPTNPLNVGLAASDVKVSPDGSIVAFLVPEASEGASLNADADTSDSVLHTYDMSAFPMLAGIVNTGRQAETDFQVMGDFVAFRAREASDNDTDLNGDGDKTDTVLQLYDDTLPVSATNPENLAVQAQSGLQLGDADADGDPDTLAFVTSEAAHFELTLNGDADAFDFVLRLFCLDVPCANPGGFVDLFQDASGGFAMSGDLVAFLTSERRQNRTTLNGDLDIRDKVVQVYRISTDTLTSSYSAGAGLAARVVPKIAGDFVAFPVWEYSQGRVPRNGDTDGRDNVMYVLDMSTVTGTNLQRAVGRKCANANTPQGPGCFDMEGDLLAFALSEWAQGGATDLNGDGDSLDHVVEIWDLNSLGGPLDDVGIASNKKGGVLVSGDIVAFRANERKNGGDINGDLDGADSVIAVYDSVAMSTSDLGQAEALFTAVDNTVVFRTSEAGPGGVGDSQNLNSLSGDVDQNDNVLQYESF